MDWKELFPSHDARVLDLLDAMLTFDPGGRATAAEALSHPYFGELWSIDAEPDCATFETVLAPGNDEREVRRLLLEAVTCQPA